MGSASPRRALFERFDDPSIERRYRAEQRTRQAWFTQWMVFGIAVLILIYWIANFFLIDDASAIAVIADQAIFMPILLAFGWMLRQPAYADAWWADILIFSLVQPALLNSIDTLAATQESGWSFNAHLCYGLGMSMAMACLVFAAAVRPFFVLTLASIAYLVAVLAIRGYDGEVIAYTAQNYVSLAFALFFFNWAIDDKARRLFAAGTSLDEERGKSERLLGNMLPAPIAERLKSQEAIADAFDDVVVVFVDLVGFTTLSQQLGPARLVELLNAFFSRADRGTDLFGLEKVKTIGDAYMAVAGALTHPPRPHKAAVDFAVWLRREAREVGRGFGVDLRLHVGLASGPAIGGVISAKRLSYDYWGHTVNLAARLQDAAAADGIAVSEAVRRAVGDSYPFREPRSIALKGVGATTVHDLELPAHG